MDENDEKPKSKFGYEIDRFIKHLNAQTEVAPLVMKLIGVKMLQESKHIDTYLKESKFEITKNEETGNDRILVPESKIGEFLKLTELVDTTSLAYQLLPINFAVSFVSQYDAYLGGLIRQMFTAKPELLNNSDKNISFSELMKFSSIEEAQEFVTEKEVESILRESHFKQFKWLEAKLGISLRTDLPSFSEFIEITERRNLFVHCNGVVSRQYLDTCIENKVKDIESVKLGEKLIADPAYFSKCYSVLFEIGVKLGQVIWRKILPDEIENADWNLNSICYDLLLKGHYKLAINLLTFATDTLKKHTQEVLSIFTINKALAYYLSGKKDECLKVLDKYDWTASSDKFKLANLVLKEDFPKALDLMKTIGSKNEHLDDEAYREWPLFTEIRKTQEFKTVYEEIFETELIYAESKPRDLEDILNHLKQMKKQAEDAEKSGQIVEEKKNQETE